MFVTYRMLFMHDPWKTGLRFLSFFTIALLSTSSLVNSGETTVQVSTSWIIEPDTYEHSELLKSLIGELEGADKKTAKRLRKSAKNAIVVEYISTDSVIQTDLIMNSVIPDPPSDPSPGDIKSYSTTSCGPAGGQKTTWTYTYAAVSSNGCTPTYDWTLTGFSVKFINLPGCTTPNI